MNAARSLAFMALLTLGMALVGCGAEDSANGGDQATAGGLAAPVTQEPAAGAAAVAEVAQADCDITPQMTEGPYYFDTGQVRRDITEGRPGTPLLVAIQLVEAGSCAPIPDAVVDIWHPDAVGQYSGFRGQGDDNSDTSGESFLRGKQTTDANGLVEFETIYPGWYPGRTVHIHFKAYTDGRTFVTSQMYFPDDVSDTVFLAEPYAARGPRGTTNANDWLFNSVPANEALMGAVTQNDDGYAVSLSIGVER